MTVETIYDTVQRLKQRYDETDPARLCKELGISMLRCAMGRDARACKGFFIRQFGVSCIVVNSDMPSHLIDIVAAHELGHAMLHADCAESGGFRDFGLFDDSSKQEHDANLFAAELLIDDDEVIPLIRSGCTVFDAACELRVPPELMDFKLRSLKKRGYPVKASLYADSRFLSGLQTVRY